MIYKEGWAGVWWPWWEAEIGWANREHGYRLFGALGVILKHHIA